ncbi:MAG: PDZ domain-containing protein [Candidatus Nanoarchaeia archaeon]
MKITWRIWILIIAVLFSLISVFSIPPMFLQDGVIIQSIEQNSTAFELGLRKGMTITSIDGKEIQTLTDYEQALDKFRQINDTSKLIINTDKQEIVGLFSSSIIDDIAVKEIGNTRLQTGLDIQGGARALVTAKNESLSSSDLQDLISIVEQRLNIYGLTDVQLREVSDLSNNHFMLVEIAGSTPQDLQALITEQGKFEAKIGNQTVFTGGQEDITHVGRTGQDAGITGCQQTEQGEICKFRFVIFLSEKAAQRHADITANLSINTSSGGQYLDKKIDFYVDQEKVSSLNIGADLKGRATTQIQISGSEIGETREQALKNTEQEMKQLQTILITGSLPYELELVKTDIISPRLGQDFTKNILLAGIFAVVAVSIFIFIRYRRFKIAGLVLLTSFSEVFIILGIAALIKWNLDLPSIAGIIAAIGTGIDSQVVILDESRDKYESLKQRIKKAFSIIACAYFTTLFALLPLTGALNFIGIGAVSAGLLKGFALATIIGITAGVLITRPAFGDIIRQLQDKEE